MSERAVTTSRRALLRPLLLVATGVLVVVVALVVAQAVRASRSAPPMSAEASSAGAVRLTYPDRSLPPPPPTEVTLPSGQVALVSLVDVSTGADGLLVDLLVDLRDSADESFGEVDDVPVGEPQTVGTLTVTVLDAYDLPRAAQDAADVTVVEDVG